jgi:sporulation protein YunB
VALLLLFFLQFFIYVEKNVKEPLMNLAKIRVRQIATQAINSAITDRIAQQADYSRLIDWRTDQNGKVSGFMLNYSEHMRITADAIRIVSGALADLKSSPERIPLGEALGSAILASFGPDIPIRFMPEGAVQVDINTRVRNAGINMILVEVYMHIMTEVAVIIPFVSEPDIVETELPISYVLVVGDVPMYYFDGKGQPVGNNAAIAPNIAIPGIAVPETQTGTPGAQGGSAVGSGGASPAAK